MIKLTRIRTDAAIHASFRGEARRRKELLLLRGQRDGNLTFSSAQWSKSKGQLRRETAKKCAYCEAPTSVVAHGDVEHFRPKSVYWWLAYSYENYLFACQICNETYKKKDFPVHGRRLSGLDVANWSEAQLKAAAGSLAPDPLLDDPRCPRAAYERAVRAERAALIDPYFTDPEPLFAWAADDALQEVRFLPSNRTTAARRAFAACEALYGLNREELRQERYKIYMHLAAHSKYLRRQDVPPDLQAGSAGILRRMMASDHPFAGMARYFVRVEWQLAL